MSSLPQRGLPDEVLPGMTEIVGSLVAPPTVSAFHVGWTVDLAQAHQTLGSELLYTLYVTSQPHHAVKVEEALARVFERHPRYRDDVLFDGQDAVQDVAGERTCYVFVAIWMSAA